MQFTSNGGVEEDLCKVKSGLVIKSNRLGGGGGVVIIIFFLVNSSTY